MENHQAVRAKQKIAHLLDTSSEEFTIQSPEQLISLISYIRDIQVEFGSYPGHPIPATAKEIGTEASATTRTYPVTLIMGQPDGFEILPGMSGSATGRPDSNTATRAQKGPLGCLRPLEFTAWMERWGPIRFAGPPPGCGRGEKTLHSIS